MLRTVLRTRVVSLPGSVHSITTRFIPTLSIPSRAAPRSITRAFTSSQISRQYGYGDRRGDFEGGSGESTYVQQPRPPRNPPSQTLWVGNLPFTAMNQQVADLFSDYGTVASVRIGTSPAGQSKGFAHVDVADVPMAEAIMKANAEAQFFLDGRGLFLDYAAAAAPRISMPADTLHFSNYSGDEALLKEAFKEFEDVIQETKLMRNPQTNASSRYGFIKFATVEDATAALTKFQGKEIAYGEALQLAYGRGKRDQAPRYTSYGEDRGGYGSRGGRSSRGGREGYGGGRPREYNGRGPPQSYGGDRGGYRPRQDYGGRGGGDSEGSYGGRSRGDSGESEPY